MKTKLHLLFWLFALVPLAFTSCDDDETFVDETTLSTSLSSVTFTKDGGQQSVSITTSATTWVATSPLESSWLTLTQNGAQLDITAAPNTEGVDRKGYILVNAGSAAAKINVVQSAGDVVLSLSTESLSFDKAGGEQRIDVICNESFSVEADAAAEWLQVAYLDGADYFTLTAAANESNNVREAKIYVVAGSVTRELAVTQVGEDIVLLPLLAEAGQNSLIDIMHFEEARGSAAMQLPDGLFNSAYYFVTENADFPQIGYMADLQGDYQQAVTATTNVDLLDDIVAAIEAKGFTLDGSIYINTTIPYAISVTESASGITISVVYSPIQEESQPTYSTLPMTDPQMSWTCYPSMNIHGATADDVMTWEEANGGTFNEAMSTYADQSGDFMWFDIDDAHQTEGLYARSAWVNVPWGGEDAMPEDNPFLYEVTSARAIYTDLTRMLWSPDGSSYFFTEEFNDLLAGENFVYIQTNQGYEFYGRDNTDGTMDVLCFGVVAFSDVLDGETVIDFQTFKNQAMGTTVELLSNSDKLIEFAKAMKERMDRVQKTLPFTPVNRVK